MNANQRAALAIREAANDWAARLSSPDLSHVDRQAFAAWLKASPVHLREYLSVEAVRLTVREALSADASDVQELLRRASSRVIPLDEFVRSAPAAVNVDRRPRRRSWARLGVAASVLLGLSLWVAWWQTDLLTPGVYSTQLGQLRRITLPDGSIAELNTDSRIALDFVAHRRDVYLMRGEVFLSVAKDARRPFRVLSDATRIRVLGTRFSVYRKPTETVVTVVEGKVAAENTQRSLEVTAGERAVLASQARAGDPSLRAVRVDAERATAWRQKRLVFDDQPLQEVITEFNRYNRQQLVVEDPALGAEGISGVFDPDKPQGLLIFLKRKGGVRTTETGDGTLLLTRRPPP